MYNPPQVDNETFHTILNRYSVRSFADTVIPPSIIDDIILGAMRAPTAGNMMMYTILRITDQKIKDKLAVTCDHQAFIAKSPLVLVFLADLQRLYDFFEISDVKGLCKTTELEYRTPKESDLLLASCDAIIAAQNAVITSEAFGLKSCYIGDIMENYEIHKELFNLPDWTFPIGMLCIGYPKLAKPPKSLIPRYPRKFIEFENSYKRLSAEELAEMIDSTYPPGSPIRKSLNNTENFGQALYKRKTGSDYAAEMVRSVKEALKKWK